jgi:hypothetical protein
LSYTVHASVGGKIAQLGQRLIDGAAKSMAEDFFRRFDEEMQKRYPDAYAAQASAQASDSVVEAASPANAAAAKIPLWAWAWVVGAAVLALAVWLGR